MRLGSIGDRVQERGHTSQYSLQVYLFCFLNYSIITSSNVFTLLSVHFIHECPEMCTRLKVNGHFCLFTLMKICTGGCGDCLSFIFPFVDWIVKLFCSFFTCTTIKEEMWFHLLSPHGQTPCGEDENTILWEMAGQRADVSEWMKCVWLSRENSLGDDVTAVFIEEEKWSYPHGFFFYNAVEHLVHFKGQKDRRGF